MKKIKSYLKSVKKGSILAYSLIIITVMFAMVGSISVATILQNKSAGSSQFSAQALQTADSGVQLAIKNMQAGGSLTSVFGSNCNDTSGTAIVTGQNLGTEGADYKLTFSDGSGDISACSTNISNVKSIKSIGTYKKTARAINVAMAATDLGCEIVSASSFSTGSGNVTCPGVKKVMSGGCEIGKSSATSTTILASFPYLSSGTPGWRCAWTTTAGGYDAAATVKAWAVCCSI